MTGLAAEYDLVRQMRDCTEAVRRMSEESDSAESNGSSVKTTSTSQRNSILHDNSGDIAHDDPGQSTEDHDAGFKTSSQSGLEREAAHGYEETNDHLEDDAISVQMGTSHESELREGLMLPETANGSSADITSQDNMMQTISSATQSVTRSDRDLVTRNRPLRRHALVSTPDNRVRRTQDEKTYGVKFFEAKQSIGVKWEDMSPLYEEVFGVWRTPGTIRNHYRSDKKRERGKKKGPLVFRLSPSRLREIS